MATEAQLATYPGHLVTLEGIDCSGKSSLSRRLKEVADETRVVFCSERDSPVGGLLRKGSIRSFSPFFKTFLFAADRAWIYEQTYLPSANRGHLVIWDRYVDSALAYRLAEYALGDSTLYDPDFIRAINGVFAVPDLIIYLNISVATSRERAMRSGRDVAYDDETLQQVREEYEQLSNTRPYRSVDAERSEGSIFEEAVSLISDAFPGYLREP